MRTLLILAIQLLAVFAEPAQEVGAYNRGFCNVHGSAVSEFKKAGGATAYCSKYLGYGTKTM